GGNNMKWFDKEGKPPAKWTSRYWQWLSAIDKNENPLKTGNINNDEFICLPCTGGGEACDRYITLDGEDTKKEILVPVFTSLATTALAEENDKALLQRVKDLTLVPEHKEVSLDGKPLKSYYLETEPFNVEAPSNNMISEVY